MENPILVILAAGSLKNKLPHLKAKFKSPALLPVGLHSAASQIINFYKGKVSRIVLVVNESDIDDVRHELIGFSNDLELLGVNSKSVVETLRIAHKYVGVECYDIIVNISTTIPVVFPAAHQVILDHTKRSSNSWSSVLVEEANVKFIYKESASINSSPFTGVFRCNGNVLKLVFDQELSNDLLSVVEELHRLCPLEYVHDSWIDVGHEINYADAKTKLISSRSFNQVHIEPFSGILKKGSTNIEKFNQEINYINMLPEEVSIFFPRLLSKVVEKEGVAYASMEYYAYPTLAELMLFWDLSSEQWNKCFTAISYVFRKFGEHKYQLGESASFDFYYGKLNSRIKLLEQSKSKYAHLFMADNISVNGVDVYGYNLIKNKLEDELRKVYKLSDFCIMHGDLCFNNMLYDPYSGIIRLIDARGSFGEACIGIYGDRKYDLAKLAHSTVGQYDYLISNLFTFDVIGLDVELNIPPRDNYNTLVKQTEKIAREMGVDWHDVLLIMGTLFLSMPPLHADDIKRQAALYVHGLYIVNLCLRGEYENLF
ncbi:hypothetical protein [Iodobacter fluviatilis]|uniref:Capsular biosynthesis protein n=1 Tax=Iodobacter fluviatilis TaxID=537 RepID=A0A377SWY6_9NEIS|nr:hypothetical protein [Iodobacter fluviatilis]TCU87976.1 hypothetical protein EV682_104145 [Iodobacter fluviatilis]STR45477.1 Uncharacterised protein [Iodobacter fluviatilis]